MHMLCAAAVVDSPSFRLDTDVFNAPFKGAPRRARCVLWGRPLGSCSEPPPPALPAEPHVLDGLLRQARPRPWTRAAASRRSWRRSLTPPRSAPQRSRRCASPPRRWLRRPTRTTSLAASPRPSASGRSSAALLSARGTTARRCTARSCPRRRPPDYPSLATGVPPDASRRRRRLHDPAQHERRARRRPPCKRHQLGPLRARRRRRRERTARTHPLPVTNAERITITGTTSSTVATIIVIAFSFSESGAASSVRVSLLRYCCPPALPAPCSPGICR